MSGQILGNFGEARCNPDKLAQPLSGRKVPFQDQASPTITWGPSTIHWALPSPDEYLCACESGFLQMELHVSMS